MRLYRHLQLTGESPCKHPCFKAPPITMGQVSPWGKGEPGEIDSFP